MKKLIKRCFVPNYVAKIGKNFSLFTKKLNLETIDAVTTIHTV